MRNLIQATEKPDYDAGVLQPLRAAQALASQEAAEHMAAAQRAHEADLNTTAAQMQPYGTYDNSTYAYAQCVWYVASRENVPPFLGNAEQWAYSLPASGYREGPPRRGAIGITQAGYYGHAVLAEQVDGDNVLISEYNYIPYSYDERWVSSGEFEWFYQ